MNTLIRPIVLALLAGAVSAVSAQQAAMPNRGPIPFIAFDRNGDGAISEQEYVTVRSERMAFRAARGYPLGNAPNAPSFAELDTNGDGRLSPAELAAGQQLRQRQRLTTGTMGTRPCRGRGSGMGRGRPSFSVFDINNDGVIVEDEFYQAHENRVAARARQGYRLRGRAQAHPYAAFDRNGDGKVTIGEFAETQALHRQSRMR